MIFGWKLANSLRSTLLRSTARYASLNFTSFENPKTGDFQNVLSPITEQPVNKKRRKKNAVNLIKKPDHWNVVAFATAEEYDLCGLKDALMAQDLYIPSELTSNEPLQLSVSGAVHAIAKYQVTPENRHLYFFLEGAVVMWNCTQIECRSVLDLIRPFEIRSYDSCIAYAEMEKMSYTYITSNKRSYIDDGVMYITNLDKSSEDISSDRYTLSNAMALTVKLGVLEAILERYIDDLEYITEDLKTGKPLRINQRGVLKKSGELFALRHSINLSTDLLDVPDFYWDREKLEVLYQTSCTYFSIAKRTKVLNEKLSHCFALIDLVSSHLSDRHHTRLEWMIIILIMVEVMFEILHAFRDYYSTSDYSSEVKH